MRHTDDVSLWPWPLILKLVRNIARVVEYPPSNFGDTMTIRFWLMGYWAWARVNQMSVRVPGIPGINNNCFYLLTLGSARRHRYRSIAYSSKCCWLDSRNWQITVFRRQNSRLGKRFSKIWLNYNVAVHTLIRIPRASLVQIDTKVTEKYTKRYPNNNNQWYAIRNGPGDLDFWPFDLNTGMRVASKARHLPNLGTLGLKALGFSNYSLCTRQTDGQTKATPTGGA